jgi:SAM-dependent methyltransferase
VGGAFAVVPSLARRGSGRSQAFVLSSGASKPMNNQTYIFQTTQPDAELTRLRALEAIFDPATRRRLLSLGLKKDARCLEVGPGAGSIMTFLAQEAAPAGRVTAVDIDPRFLQAPPPNVDVVKGDVLTVDLPPASFDLIHARYVLVHLAAAPQVLERLWTLLKPGGALLLEEPDFALCKAGGGEKEQLRAFDKVRLAVLALFTAKGADPSIGSRLPSLLQSLGARDLSVETDAPLVPGRSPLADMMGQSAQALKPAYVSTTQATPADVESFISFTQSPNSWALYYTTLSTSARK